MGTLAWMAAAAAVVMGCQEKSTAKASGSDPPRVVAGSEREAGRYLVVSGGCNDCHTDDYLRTEGKVPESKWLLGSSIGWRGPWGTTYPPNLRLRAHEMTEDAWVSMLRTRTQLPPMPWMDVNQMSDADLRALYVYIRSMGPAGRHAHPALGPGVEPTTPFISLIPVVPGAAEVAREKAPARPQQGAPK